MKREVTVRKISSSSSAIETRHKYVIFLKFDASNVIRVVKGYLSELHREIQSTVQDINSVLDRFS